MLMQILTQQIQKMKPLLNFKDSYIMHVNNGYRFSKEIPIMSFQTNKNGEFSPQIEMPSGTLRWVVDGVEQITNTPSYSLVGNTVDVKVYANDVVFGQSVTTVGFNNDAVIGVLDFSFFRLDGSFLIADALGMTGVTFSTFANSCTSLQIVVTGISNLDLSNVAVNGILRYDRNSSLNNISFNPIGNTTTLHRGYNCNLSSLDLSSFTSITGIFEVYNNPNIPSITLPVAGGNFTSFRVHQLNLSALDLSNYTINGVFYCYLNSNLSSLSFSSSGNSSTTFFAYGCNLSNIDLSSFSTMTNNLFLQNNSNLSILTPPISASLTQFVAFGCNFTTIDLSNYTLSNKLDLSSNIGLTSFNLPNITSAINTYNISNCALNLTTVDNIFSNINTYMSANAPTNDLTVNTSGGSNAIPTGGAANTDIVNLDTIVYPNAGFNFTALINAA